MPFYKERPEREPKPQTRQAHKPTRVQDLPTYESECDDLTNRLNRTLRKLRSIEPAERYYEGDSRSLFYTTEMAYLINDIKFGPAFIAPQLIRKAIDMIGELESYVAKQSNRAGT